ncbi:MAG: hypothetical protein Q9226_003202 [Calogaya cf. arnoldii]
MSGQDLPPGRKADGKHLSGGAVGKVGNGLRSFGNDLYDHHGHPTAFNPQVNLERSKLFSPSMAGNFHYSPEIDNSSGPYYAAAPGQDYVHTITEEQHEELNRLAEKRDAARQAHIEAGKARVEAENRSDDYEQQVRHPQQNPQVLRDSSNPRRNQILRPATLATGATATGTIASSLGKRNTDDRDEDNDENGSNQVGPRTRRRPNSERITDISGSPRASDGNGLRSPNTLGRRRRSHPYTQMTLLGPSRATPHQGYTYAGPFLNTSSSTGLFQEPPVTYDTSLQPSQLSQYGLPTIGGDSGHFPGSDLPGVLPHEHNDPNLLDNTINAFQEVLDNTQNTSVYDGFNDDDTLGSSSMYPNFDHSEYQLDPNSALQPAQQPLGTRGNPFPNTTVTGKRSRDESSDLDEDSDEESNEAHSTKRQKIMTPSKRCIKRSGMIAGGKNIPKDDEKEKGIVRKKDDGSMFVLHENKWIPAAYHHERRLGLLRRAASMGQYRYPPTAGVVGGSSPTSFHKHGCKTAFHPRYVNVNVKVREGRPHLLYQWDPSQGYFKTPFVHPGFMHDPADGILLLDLKNHPIRDFPELPITVSAQVEGFWIEYWCRLDKHIRVADILARCPPFSQKNPNTMYRSIVTKSAYGNDRSKDRLATGTKAWLQKEGSKEIQARYEAILPNKVRAETRYNNTTTWFRDLTPKETEAICHVNQGKGSALLRAGTKKLDEGTKKDRLAKSDPELVATYQRLLREKHDADMRDLGWAHPGCPDPGTAFPDPITGLGGPLNTNYGQSTNMQVQGRANNAGITGYGQSTNTQVQGRANNAGNDNIIDLEGDTTLVENDQFQDGFYPSNSNGGMPGSSAQQEGIGNTIAQGAGYHWMVPKTPQQIRSITNALENALQTCRRLTGEKPPMTDANQCYMHQFDQLKAWLKAKTPGETLNPWENWHTGWDHWHVTNRYPAEQRFRPEDVGLAPEDDILNPNQVSALQESSQHNSTSARNESASSANGGAPTGYIAAGPAELGYDPEGWVTRQGPQPNDFDNLQNGMMENTAVPQVGDGNLDYFKDLDDLFNSPKNKSAGNDLPFV